MTQYRCCEKGKDIICPRLDLIRAKSSDFKLSRNESVKTEFMMGVNSVYDCACKRKSLECMIRVKEILVDFQNIGKKSKKARANDNQPNLVDE